MGANNSAERNRQYQADLARLRIRADQLYRERVESYNFAYHGDYYRYISGCQAQHELDCIPEYLRYGNAVRR
jgi:hypothetical protein